MRLPLLCVALTLSCSGEPSAPVDHDARRATLRQELQARLGPAYEAPVAALASADLEQGAAVYGKSCSACHGDKADGHGHRAGILDPKPANLVGARGRDYYSDAGQLQLVREGISGTGMPPFAHALRDEDIVAAYAYVVSLRQ